MNFLDQISMLGQSYIWLPGLMFAMVAGGIYLFTSAAAPPAPVVPISDDESSLSLSKKANNRSANRRQGNPIEVHIATPDDKKVRTLGSVLDRSVGGMRLAVFSEMTPGSVISVLPTQADRIEYWVDLEIKSCRPSESMPGQFEIGCQYVKSPPYSIQLLFG